MIFDSCFMIDLLKDDEKAFDKLLEIEDNGTTQVITTITVFELIFGAEKSRESEKEKIRAKKIYETMLIANLDHKSAVCAAEIFASSVKKGRTLPLSDCLIAGIALANNETILTRNVKDFNKIEGLKIETY